MRIADVVKLAGWIILGLLLSCDSNSPDTTSDTAPRAGNGASAVTLGTEEIDTATSVATAYLQQIDQDLREANQAIHEFAAAVNNFLDSPGEPTLQQLRERWLAANSAYELTALHRHFAESILDDADALRLFQLDYQLNHWPILPGYIDTVSNYPASGIVNDMTVTLETENLRSQHGAFDINEVSIGFHVLEFLIWGENADEESLRPASDYLPQVELTPAQQADGMNLVDLSNNRRRELLRVLTALLQEDYSALVSLWSTASAELRPVTAATAPTSLQHMLNGMIGLLREEILASSLYLMLNGEFNDSRPSLFSATSQNAVSAQLTGLELSLRELGQQEGSNLDQLLNRLSDDYREFFLQNLDASKECLVVLYSTASREAMTLSETEFKVVECINSLTNMIDYLERIVVDQR